MAEWQRVVNTTIAKYLRDEEVNILRNRKLTAMLQSKGRIIMNQSGERLNWRVKFKRATVQGQADGDTLTFDRKLRHKQAELDWRGYATTDSVTKKERMMNKGTEAIVRIYENIAKDLKDDMTEAFCDELYVDGNASGNEKRIHGVESAFAATQTISVATTTSTSPRTANAADYVGYPNDTYANLSTVLGNYGGAWNSNWPEGAGDAHFDFWSPVLVNYTGTGFGGATATWKDQCIDALRFGIIKSQRNKSKKGMLDMVVVTNEMYRLALTKNATKEQINVNRGEESELVKLGFKDVFNLDGVDVTWEYGVPNNIGYGFNVDEMTLHSLQNQLFVPEGPDWDIGSSSYRFSVDFYGNLQFNPRHFVKFLTLA